MKNLTTTKSFLMMLLAAFVFFASCDEAEDAVKKAVEKVAPTATLTSSATPAAIEKGDTLNIEFTFTSPTVDVQKWTVTELISEADGTAVSKNSD